MPEHGDGCLVRRMTEYAPPELTSYVFQATEGPTTFSTAATGPEPVAEQTQNEEDALCTMHKGWKFAHRS